jgi:hypothetical protein
MDSEFSKWQQLCSEYKRQDLAKVFPDAKGIVTELAAASSLKVQLLHERIKEELHKIGNEQGQAGSDFTKWLLRECLKITIVSELVSEERKLWKLKSFDFSERTKDPSSFFFGRDLEKARSYPIIEIAKRYLTLKAVGKRAYAICPFHDDKKPSLTFFLDTNSYYCFACCTGGDVIDFVLRIENTTFKRVIEILTRG